LEKRPLIADLEQMMEWWTAQERYAFFCCVRNDERKEPEDRDRSGIAAIDELFWAYNSKTVARTQQAATKARSVAHNALPEAIRRRMSAPEPPKELIEYGKALTYEFLLRECCAKLGIKDSHICSLEMLEVYLYELVIAKAVVAMTPEQRHAFLTRFIAIEEIQPGFPASGLSGPASTLAILAAAQASGFGVYVGATTALGFLSHAVGLTLPFAVYTGMTSTISFLIGPIGFLATTAWLGFVLTSPEWCRILRGLLHVVAMRARYEYTQRRLTAGAGW
jgi:hypothetical protein